MSVSVSPRDLSKPTSIIPPKEPPRQLATSEAPPPPAEATPEEKKDDLLSPKFAAIARQEKQLRAQVMKLKAEREAFEREKQAQLNGYIPKDKLKSDPLSAFQDAGITYDDVAQRLLNANQSEVDPTIRALQAKIAELEANQQSLTKKAEETQSAAYKQAVDSIRHKVKGIVESNPDFELIKSMEQHEAVVALIEETFKADGYVMSEDEAAKEVESYLEEQALRMAGFEKIKKKLAPPQADPVPQKQPNTQQQQMKTLTNAVSSSPRPRYTESERRQRAILAAQGLLKE